MPKSVCELAKLVGQAFSQQCPQANLLLRWQGLQLQCMPTPATLCRSRRAKKNKKKRRPFRVFTEKATMCQLLAQRSRQHGCRPARRQEGRPAATACGCTVHMLQADLDRFKPNESVPMPSRVPTESRALQQRCQQPARTGVRSVLSQQAAATLNAGPLWAPCSVHVYPSLVCSSMLGIQAFCHTCLPSPPVASFAAVHCCRTQSPITSSRVTLP